MRAGKTATEGGGVGSESEFSTPLFLHAFPLSDFEPHSTIWTIRTARSLNGTNSDILDSYKHEHTYRKSLINVFNAFSSAWWYIIDMKHSAQQ